VKENETARGFSKDDPCDVCMDRPVHRYRVVDADFKTVWSGGCRECAHMIVAGRPDWRVDHA